MRHGQYSSAEQEGITCVTLVACEIFYGTPMGRNSRDGRDGDGLEICFARSIVPRKKLDGKGKMCDDKVRARHSMGRGSNCIARDTLAAVDYSSRFIVRFLSFFSLEAKIYISIQAVET